MIFRLNIFIKTLLLFAAAMAVGIWSAYKYNNAFHEITVPQVHFTIWDLVWPIAIFVFFSFIMSRYQRLAGWTFRIFLTLIILSGSQLVFGSLAKSPWDLYLALIFLAVVLVARNVATHDLAMILGIGGISAALGYSLTPGTVVTILVILSFYDIIAVYKTRHMVKLAEGMIQSGAIFGFLVPTSWQGFFNFQKTAVPGRDFMILGSGDIGLPIILASSVVKISLASSLIVAAFSAIGLFVTHLIFVNQKERKAMAALPPIATAAILGYLLSTLIL